MKFLSFLCILTIQAKFLDSLSKTQFGQALETAMLIYLQVDDTKVKEALTEIYHSLLDQQVEEDRSITENQSQCSVQIDALDAQILQLRFDKTQIEVKLQELNEVSNSDVLNQKRKEVESYKASIAALINQRQQEEALNQLDIDEIREQTKYLKILEESLTKKVQGQQQFIQIDGETKKALKKLKHKVNSAKIDSLLNVLTQQLDQPYVNIEYLVKIIQLITKVVAYLDQEVLSIETLAKEQQESSNNLLEKLQTLLTQAYQEFQMLEERKTQTEMKVRDLESNHFYIVQNLDQKLLQRESKQNFCTQMMEEYEQDKSNREDMILLTSQLLDFLMLDISAVKDYYWSKDLE